MCGNDDHGKYNARAVSNNMKLMSGAAALCACVETNFGRHAYVGKAAVSAAI